MEIWMDWIIIISKYHFTLKIEMIEIDTHTCCWFWQPDTLYLSICSYVVVAFVVIATVDSVCRILVLVLFLFIIVIWLRAMIYSVYIFLGLKVFSVLRRTHRYDQIDLPQINVNFLVRFGCRSDNISTLF